MRGDAVFIETETTRGRVVRVAVFSTKKYDRQYLEAANSAAAHEFDFFETTLDSLTASAASDYDCVSAFVNDRIDRIALEILAAGKTRLVALRCAGFNNVDLEAARDLGIAIVRVPAYSPYAVAEHVIAILMALYRTTHRSYNRVREGNFSLEGMVGHEVNGRTVGIIGTGTIGSIVAKLFEGFGVERLAYDVSPNPDVEAMGIPYVSLDDIWKRCQIITLHCPLLPDTRHMVNEDTIAKMQDGVTLINTSRGALIDTDAVYRALKTRKIGHLGIDVYEEEDDLFFLDHSSEIIQDDLIMRLTTFPNVLITGHQAFFTNRALANIADTTVANISEFERTGACANSIVLPS